MKIDYIDTVSGRLAVDRKLGEYTKTLPTQSAPHGAWWRADTNHGYVPVASNSPSLLAVIRAVNNLAM